MPPTAPASRGEDRQPFPLLRSPRQRVQQPSHEVGMVVDGIFDYFGMVRFHVETVLAGMLPPSFDADTELASL